MIDLSLQTDSGLYQSWVEHASDAIVVAEGEPCDAPLSILYVNQAFERMTGYSRVEVLGRSPGLLQGPKTERQQVERIHRAISRNEPVQATLTNYRKDGTEFHVELHIVPLPTAEGHPRRWLSVQRNVSDRFSQELETSHERNSKHLRLLAAGIAHDFNNLLTTILGFAGLTRISMTDPQAVDRKTIEGYLDQIETASQNASQLCRQLLEYSGTAQLSTLPAQCAEPARSREQAQRVLIVEDRADVQNLLETTLMRYQFRISTESSGSAGLNAIQNQESTYDLLILDIQLPGINGLEILRNLRHQQPHTPVVLISGYCQHDLTEIIESDPFTKYLPKPFSIGDLESVLVDLNVLARASATRQ